MSHAYERSRNKGDVRSIPRSINRMTVDNRRALPDARCARFGRWGVRRGPSRRQQSGGVQSLPEPSREIAAPLSGLADVRRFRRGALSNEETSPSTRALRRTPVALHVNGAVTHSDRSSRTAVTAAARRQQQLLLDIGKVKRIIEKLFTLRLLQPCRLATEEVVLQRRD